MVLNPAHYDMRFAKPLDEALLHEVFSKFEKIITVEDGTVVGGFGSAVLEFMNEHNYKAEIKILGIPDRLVEHGTPKELHHECGYDAQAIKEAVLEMMKGKVSVSSLTAIISLRKNDNPEFFNQDFLFLVFQLGLTLNITTIIIK